MATTSITFLVWRNVCPSLFCTHLLLISKPRVILRTRNLTEAAGNTQAQELERKGNTCRNMNRNTNLVVAFLLTFCCQLGAESAWYGAFENREFYGTSLFFKTTTNYILCVAACLNEVDCAAVMFNEETHNCSGLSQQGDLMIGKVTNGTVTYVKGKEFFVPVRRTCFPIIYNLVCILCWPYSFDVVAMETRRPLGFFGESGLTSDIFTNLRLEQTIH